jgi:hypothetical protein
MNNKTQNMNVKSNIKGTPEENDTASTKEKAF